MKNQIHYLYSVFTFNFSFADYLFNFHFPNNTLAIRNGPTAFGSLSPRRSLM